MKRPLSIIGFLLLWAPTLNAGQSQPGLPEPVTPSTTGSSYLEISELVRSKQWAQAAALTEELHRRNPGDVAALYWLGVSRLKLHEPVAAARAFRSAEKLGLNSSLSHEGLGLAYYDLNQFWLFEEQMQKAASLDPRDSMPDYYRGLYRWSIRSDAAGALEFFEKAIRLQPGDWKSLYQAGNCFEQLGKLEDARDRYTRAISLVEKGGERFGWPYQGMARLLIDEKPEAALEYAKKAVSLQSEEYSHHMVLAKVYERLGNLPDAIREAKAATDQNPTDSTARYALYKLYREAGDPQSAKELKIFEQTKALYDRD